MNRLKDKIIVITGASSGIGEKLAIKVAEKGAHPILLARSEVKLKTISEKIKKETSVQPYYFKLDVSDRDAVERVFVEIIKDIGNIDVLINNAGFGVFDAFHEANLDDLEKMFHVNVIGLMNCTKQVIPSMIERNMGHIVNIASQAGKLATPKTSGYAATKHAVLGFTNSLRLELRKTNIHVSAVNPGPIETNFFESADQSGTYVKNVKKYMLQADTVAEKIVYLMERPKRELNIPYWMNIGSNLYNMFPRLADKLAGPFLNKK
ncbi:SDR family oxidoreductase [Oceanobacillus caeni]|uniref:Oxidoreductase n=1 Tax=Oceanobacillus caeni TaxID=405946 RepID=A0ABR5MFZ5_9BACI|nr:MULTISPECIES: SDR family oxidoreductase [Bacillaceae]KKE78677.1 oxidoreductase [Bacilli bacterium VT-13-104]PZD83744.1 SDR family NAD(P)-dependent oxidoreductase [Bacilli bacterium]KPH71318.1 oxidoreductase [Oceanobacillus caeni]MBU8791989.1 SDR family oxidoreductase [Oceanobacillus caeni]MCR1835877.1 SDR family oxidoreductase [Oceanobacillus caeni]